MKLTSKTKKGLPKSDFGLPGAKKYPMPDKAHAANAKARATQMVNAGKLSPSSAAKIDAKANKVLGVEKSAADRKADKGVKESSAKDKKSDAKMKAKSRIHPRASVY